MCYHRHRQAVAKSRKLCLGLPSFASAINPIYGNSFRESFASWIITKCPRSPAREAINTTTADRKAGHTCVANSRWQLSQVKEFMSLRRRRFNRQLQHNNSDGGKVWRRKNSYHFGTINYRAKNKLRLFWKASVRTRGSNLDLWKHLTDDNGRWNGTFCFGRMVGTGVWCFQFPVKRLDGDL